MAGRAIQHDENCAVGVAAIAAKQRKGFPLGVPGERCLHVVGGKRRVIEPVARAIGGIRGGRVTDDLHSAGKHRPVSAERGGVGAGEIIRQDNGRPGSSQ